MRDDDDLLPVYQDEVKAILDAVGNPTAMVVEETILLEVIRPGADPSAVIPALCFRYEVPVASYMRVVDLAQAIRARRTRPAPPPPQSWLERLHAWWRP